MPTPESSATATTLTLNSTLRDLLAHVPTYQPTQVDDFYRPGWWVRWPEAEQLNYIRDLGLSDVALSGKSFMDVGCAEGYACFHAEQQGARFVIGCDGHGWKYGTGEADPWGQPRAQNMMLVFEVLRMLKRSRVVRLVQDLESADFVDSVFRLSHQKKIDVVLCAGLFYHSYNPVTALRNLFLVTGERAVINIPDFRAMQADGRIFTPYYNLPEQNDFNYAKTVSYGASNNRLWNLAPDDWAAMIEFAGFQVVNRTPRGPANVFECVV
jgi:SAM-dependent methyltransferase